MIKAIFSETFDNRALSFDKLMLLQEEIRRKKPYIIFFTARSGSSYLADLLLKTRLAGRPGEYFNPPLMSRTLHTLSEKSEPPIESIIDYVLWLMDNRSSANAAFGFKGTYPHFQPFILTGLDRLLFSRFTLFYLYRNNILNQAISLYIMTETRLSHKNREVSDDILQKVQSLPYDQGKIRHWITHIRGQEKNFERYFKTTGREVSVLEYQQLSADPAKVVTDILRKIGVKAHVQVRESNYKKVRGAKNDNLASRFLQDKSNLKFLEQSGIPESRLEGD
jgi:trehalose 2-sulfotransferase